MNQGIRPLLAQSDWTRLTLPCWAQYKLNGVRGLGQGGNFQSRDLQPYGPHLRHITEPMKDLFPHWKVTDGEFYVHGWSLQRINGAVTPVRVSEREDTKLVQYHIFDIVDFEMPFLERFSLPAFPSDVIKLVPARAIHTRQQAADFFVEAVNAGYEGVIYRSWDCPYTQPLQKLWNGKPPTGRLRSWSDQDNRVWHMLKRKNWLDAEFPFFSIRRTFGEKGEPGFIMTCALPEGKTFDLGSGLTQAEQEHYIANPPVGRQIKVKFLTFSDDRKPQNATILCIL